MPWKRSCSSRKLAASVILCISQKIIFVRKGNCCGIGHIAFGICVWRADDLMRMQDFKISHLQPSSWMRILPGKAEYVQVSNEAQGRKSENACMTPYQLCKILWDINVCKLHEPCIITDTPSYLRFRSTTSWSLLCSPACFPACTHSPATSEQEHL